MTWAQLYVLSLVVLCAFSGLSTAVSLRCKLGYAWVSSRGVGYTNVVPPLGIKRQCAGTCAFNATATALESAIAAETGNSISLSSAYLETKALLTAGMSYLASQGKKRGVKEGSNFDEVVTLISSGWGLIPDRVWQPTSDYHTAMALFREKIRGRSSPKKKDVERFVELLKKVNESFPKEFDYDGGHYTPQEFYRAVVPEVSFKVWISNFEQRYYLERGKKKIDKFEFMRRSIDGKFDALESEMISAIDRGKSVYAEVYWQDRSVDDFSGEMVRQRSTGIPLRTQAPLIAHSINVVGYQLGADKKVKLWLVQNSWGEGAGDEGYYHMGADYCRQYAIRLFVPR